MFQVRLGVMCGVLAFSSLCLAESVQTLSAHDILRAESDSLEIRPRYMLLGPNNRAVSDETFRGRYQLIAFGYTFCPDICPTTLVEVAEILKQLGDEAEKVQPIFISIDPDRDTAQILKTYTEFFDRRILGLTGSPALVQRAARNFKIRYAKVPAQDGNPQNYAVDHAAGLILLGPDGLFLKKFAYGTPVESVSASLKSFLQSR